MICLSARVILLISNSVSFMSLIKKVILFFIGVFSGVLLALSLTKNSEQNELVSKKSPSSVERLHARPRVSSQPLLKDLAEDPERWERELASLSCSELESLVSMIAAGVGIDGIDSQKRQQIEEMLARMYEIDPLQTVEWLVNLPNGANRRIFFRSVLGSEAEKDPSQALALAESFQSRTGDALSLPDNLAQKLVSLGPDALLQVMELTVGDTNDVSDLPHKYPKDFDFKKVVEGMAKLKGGLAENQNFYVSTSSLLAGWLTQDAQAAYDWFVSAPQNQKDIVGGVPGFFQGYAAVAQPEDYARFAAQFTLAGEPTDQSWSDATYILMTHPDTSVLNAFLAEASKHQDSTLVFRKLLEESNGYSGSGFDRLRRSLLDQAPEDARTEYLSNAPEHVQNALGLSK